MTFATLLTLTESSACWRHQLNSLARSRASSLPGSHVHLAQPHLYPSPDYLDRIPLRGVLGKGDHLDSCLLGEPLDHACLVISCIVHDDDVPLPELGEALTHRHTELLIEVEEELQDLLFLVGPFPKDIVERAGLCDSSHD